MHISVEKGAPQGASFHQYVGYLADNAFIGKDGRAWVDYIRTKSNEANHEIKLMSRQDADDLLSFTEMLLRQLYEFPARLPKSPDAPATAK